MSDVLVGRARELASFREMIAHARLGAGRFALPPWAYLQSVPPRPFGARWCVTTTGGFAR